MGAVRHGRPAGARPSRGAGARAPCWPDHRDLGEPARAPSRPGQSSKHGARSGMRSQRTYRGHPRRPGDRPGSLTCGTERRARSTAGESVAQYPDDLPRWREAAQIASRARELGLRLTVPGARRRDVAEAVEAFIRDAGAQPAFPANLSRNDEAAHYTPSPDDVAVFEAGDLVKVNVGAHIEGAIADTADTVEVGGRTVTRTSSGRRTTPFARDRARTARGLGGRDRSGDRGSDPRSGPETDRRPLGALDRALPPARRKNDPERAGPRGRPAGRGRDHRDRAVRDERDGVDRERTVRQHPALPARPGSERPGARPGSTAGSVPFRSPRAGRTLPRKGRRSSGPGACFRRTRSSSSGPMGWSRRRSTRSWSDRRAERSSPRPPKGSERYARGLANAARAIARPGRPTRASRRDVEPAGPQPAVRVDPDPRGVPEDTSRPGRSGRRRVRAPRPRLGARRRPRGRSRAYRRTRRASSAPRSRRAPSVVAVRELPRPLRAPLRLEELGEQVAVVGVADVHRELGVEAVGRGVEPFDDEVGLVRVRAGGGLVDLDNPAAVLDQRGERRADRPLREVDDELALGGPPDARPLPAGAAGEVVLVGTTSRRACRVP